MEIPGDQRKWSAKEQVCPLDLTNYTTQRQIHAEELISSPINKP